MYTARRMTPSEFTNAAERMFANQGEARRCFCIERSCGRVVARKLSWSDAVERARIMSEQEARAGVAA